MAALIRKPLTLTRNPWFNSTVRTSYIVLIPEVPPDTAETNPVLRTDRLPEFDSITAEQCFTGVGKLSLEHETNVWQLEEELSNPDKKLGFETTMDRLEKLSVPLDSAWGTAKTLYVCKTDKLSPSTYQIIHNRARKARSQKFQSKPIYDACKSWMTSDSELNPTETRLVKKYVLEGRLNGLELAENAKAHYKKILEKLNQERKSFRAKIDESTRRFGHIISDPVIMHDFPSDLLRAMAVDSSHPSRGPWKVTLQPSILPRFLEYCPDSNLRWNAWMANRIRASAALDKDINNSLHLEEIRYQRRDQARLLGYESYAHMSMETKMAGSVDNVRNMIDSLLEKAKTAQERELASLQSFSQERGFDGSLQPWDVPYWRRKQKRTVFKYEEGELREYFPFPKVLEGLFNLANELFGIVIEKVEGSVWAPNVQLYRIVDNSGRVLAHFYLDPYLRPGEKMYDKETSAWMIGCRNRSQKFGMLPLATLAFNFPQPLHGIPALLSFNDVKLLFGKFGHALQHLLSEAPYSEIAGLNNLEWDAVGVASHFLQCWLTDWETVQKVSSHFENGHPMPKETFDHLTQASVHMAGYDLVQQLYLSSLDLEMHAGKEFWVDLMNRLHPKFFPFALSKQDAHPCSFADIMSGEWGASYYAHFWSHLIATDAFGAFHEADIKDRSSVSKIGQRFHETWLSQGGSCHASESFRLFRGRDPCPEALVKHLALSSKPHSHHHK